MNLTGLGTARRLAKTGFGVYGMDYEGHGKSDGLSGYIPNFDHLVDDVSSHYTTICGNVDFWISKSQLVDWYFFVCKKCCNEKKDDYIIGESIWIFLVERAMMEAIDKMNSLKVFLFYLTLSNKFKN